MTDEDNKDQDSPEKAEDIILGTDEDEEKPEAPILERREASTSNGLKRAIFEVPIEVVVSVGKARPLIGDLLTMGRNHLLPLDSRLEDPVELLVKDRVIAKGELTQIPDSEGQLGIRLTEVINITSLAK